MAVHPANCPLKASNPAVAGAMRHVDVETEPRLERILSEMRTQARSGGRA